MDVGRGKATISPLPSSKLPIWDVLFCCYPSAQSCFPTAETVPLKVEFEKGTGSNRGVRE